MNENLVLRVVVQAISFLFLDLAMETDPVLSKF